MSPHNYPRVVKMTQKTGNKIVDMANTIFYDKNSTKKKRENAIDVLFKLGMHQRVREMENELSMEHLEF